MAAYLSSTNGFDHDSEPRNGVHDHDEGNGIAPVDPLGGIDTLDGRELNDEEERYVPRFCYYRCLAPFTCFFKVHGGAGKIPALTDGQWATLFACCLCGFLNAYDWELWPLALTQFQHDLNVTETDIGLIGSAIRLGNALSFPVTALGDLYGRKAVMVIASALYVFFMALTGFAPSAALFTLFQVISRGFMAAQNTLSTTMIVEGLRSEDRGWGVGVFSAIGILGSALTLIVFGFVGDLPDAWRWLYATSGILFLPLFAITSRVPESKRFLDQKAIRKAAKAKSRGQVVGIGEDDIEEEGEEAKPATKDSSVIQGETEEQLARRRRHTRWIYLTRTLWCAVVSVLNGFSFAPSETLKIKKFVEIHGLSSGTISIVQITTGVLAFASFTLAGSLSDRFGRKKFLMVFNTVCSAGVVVFFLAPAGSNLVFIANFIQLLAGFVLLTVKGTYFAELFPTSRRSSAQGLFVVCEVGAGGVALMFESLMYGVWQEHWTPCAILASPAMLSGIFIGLFLPEVNSRDLEHVSPELFPLDDGHVQLGKDQSLLEGGTAVDNVEMSAVDSLRPHDEDDEPNGKFDYSVAGI